MATERRPKGGNKGKGGKQPAQDRHAEPRESFHLPQALLDALQAYVGRTRPATSKSAVIRLALEEFLAKEGLWRLPGDQPGQAGAGAEGGAS